MKLYKCLAFIMVIQPVFARADTLSVEDALHSAYDECKGIEENLADLKKMAGINTAVTGVGTGLAAGATIVGVKKASIDKVLSVNLKKTRASLEDVIQTPLETPQEKADFVSDLDNLNLEEELGITPGDTDEEKLEKQSKTLGNVRTGLLGATTITGVAGAIIAGKNKTDESLRNQIQRCISAIDALRFAYKAARFTDEPTYDAEYIIAACEPYEYIDLSKIDKRATGAMISSVATATTGAAGTVVSALANSKNVRSDDSDAGIKKEKNLNTAANVLAGGATVSSAVATVFNATQIAAIKKVLEVAENCSGAL